MTSGQDIPDEDGISEEARLMAAAARAAAAGVPLGGALGALITSAATAPGRDMSPGEIRALAASTMEQAHRVSYLLGRLAGLLEDDWEPR